MKKLFFLLLSCIVAQGSVHAMDGYPLHKAVLRGDSATVKALCTASNWANINLQDIYGRTPLYCAAFSGHLAIAQLLLDRGANINIQDKDCSIPLHCAAVMGHQEIVKLLLNHVTDINLRDNYGFTALHLAAQAGYYEIVKLLLKQGANANIQNRYGKTPMSWATERGYHGIVDLLKSWPAVFSGSRAGRLAFCMAMHPRVSADSPANALPQYVFQEICSYLRPSVLIDDQESVAGYKRIYEKQQQKIPGWCTIS